MDAESPVLPVIASRDPHSLEDAARTALGTCTVFSHSERLVDLSAS